MPKVTLADVLALPVDDRLTLIEEAWDSIAADQRSVSITPAQHEELDRRLDAYQASPEMGATWDEVKSTLRQQA
jgi:putative addiction module component (TIGR02574 family)